jgi:uncharacterized membrane protein HdeD (DUF308 family)
MTELEKRHARLELFCGLGDLQKKWGWFLAIGIALILIGLMAIALAGLTTLFSVIVLASVLIAGGGIQMINTLKTYRGEGFFLSLLTSIFYLVVGILLFLNPQVGGITLTLLLAAFYMVGGISKMVVSAVNRFANWGWMFFSGFIAFMLGLLIWIEWPQSGLWVIGMFVGIDLITVGWLWVALSLTAKDAGSKEV